MIIHYAQPVAHDEHGTIYGPTACGNPTFGTYATNNADDVTCAHCASHTYDTLTGLDVCEHADTTTHQAETITRTGGTFHVNRCDQCHHMHDLTQT